MIPRAEVRRPEGKKAFEAVAPEAAPIVIKESS